MPRVVRKTDNSKSVHAVRDVRIGDDEIAAALSRLPRGVVSFIRYDLEYPIDERYLLEVFELYGEAAVMQALREQQAELTREAYGDAHPALQRRTH